MYATTDVKHPALMSTPWFMVSVLAIYLFAVAHLGPHFMRFRKPFELKSVIIVHNVVQVVSCLYVVYELFQITDYQILRFWECNVLEFSGPKVERHFSLCYFLFWLKLSELIETGIFVMRKKQSQVTKLHVFHHIATITLIYLLINYNSNGFDALFSVLLNSNVHIVMYSYYLIAAVADKGFVRALTPVKKSITVMQMSQFALILFHSIWTSVNCGVNKVIFSYFMIVIAVMFYGFYDFYQTCYKKAAKAKKSSVVSTVPEIEEVPDVASVFSM